MHVRQQLRERLLTVLTGLATTGANVTANRVYPYAADNLPALNIVTGAEARLEDAETMGPEQVRAMSVMLEARAIASSEVDDTLDTIAAEAEAALAADATLNDLALYLNYEGLEVELAEEGEQLIGLAKLTYTLEYAVHFGDAQTSL